MKIAYCAARAVIHTALIREPFPVTFKQEPLHIFDSQLTSNANMRKLQDFAATAMFGIRAFIETNEAILQFLPYGVIRNRSGKVLGYNRPLNTDEGRLAGDFSIGFGGHMEPADCTAASGLMKDYFADAAKREVNEELAWPLATNWGTNVDMKGPVALIHDTSNDVGKVHLGIVYLITVEDDIAEQLVASSPNEVINLRWLNGGDLAIQSSPENWTKFLIEKFIPILAQYP